MAISRTTSTTYSPGAATSWTLAFNPTATNGYMQVDVHTSGAASDPTGITFNGSAMSLRKRSTLVIGEFSSLWGIATGSTGSQNIVCSFGSSVNSNNVISAWDGVDQGTTYDGNAVLYENSSTANSSISVTTNYANGWIVGLYRAGSGGTPGTNYSAYNTGLGVTVASWDSGAIASPGANTCNVTQSASFGILVGQAIIPFGSIASANTGFFLMM